MGKESTNALLAMNFINSLQVEEKAAEAEYLKRNPEQFFIDTITLCLDESKKNAEVCLRKKFKEIKEEFLPEERGAEFVLFKKRVASAFRGDVSEYRITQKKLKEEARYIDYRREEKIKIVSKYLVDRLNQSHSFKNKIAFLNKFEQETRASVINEVLFKHFSKPEPRQADKNISDTPTYTDYSKMFNEGEMKVFIAIIESRYPDDSLHKACSYAIQYLKTKNKSLQANFGDVYSWLDENKFLTDPEDYDSFADQNYFLSPRNILTKARGIHYDLVLKNL